METIGFLGVFDKKDILLDMSKVMTILGKRVLIIDATSMQRFRYITPQIDSNPRNAYISEYQGIDVALGFMNIMGVMQYLGTNELKYDFVIIDTDNLQTFNSFGLINCKKLFMVTSYDIYDLHRMMDILRYIQTPISMTKVIFSADITDNQQKYFNKLLEQTNVKAKNIVVEFADTTKDRKATLANQLVREIKYKNHTDSYKDSLEYLTAIASEGQILQSEIRRIIRRV